MKLINKRIILTGATSGIGRSLALKLAAEEASLAICGLSPEKMESLLNEISNRERVFHAQTFSVTEESAILEFVNEAKAQLGGVDILINCAGLNSARGTVSEIKTEDLDYMIAVNLRAPFIFMREVFNIMKERQSGTVVNVLSSVCLSSNESLGAYTASKAGMDALTKIFRKEARKEGVKVCSIYPGGVNTPFRNNVRNDYMSPESAADAIISIMSLPDDVAVHELVFRPMVEANF